MSKKILTPEDLVKRAKNYKKLSSEEFEQKLKEYEALHCHKFKERVDQIILPSKAWNNMAASINNTQLIMQSIKTVSVTIPKIKTALPDFNVISSLYRINIAIKSSINLLPQIDWDKVNAYTLIEELESKDINPKIIKDIDIKQLSELIKETKSIKKSLAEIIKELSGFEDELGYEVLINTITEIQATYKKLKRQEMILRIAQECFEKDKSVVDKSSRQVLSSLSNNERSYAITILQAYADGAKSRKEIAGKVNITESYIRDIEEKVKAYYQIDTTQQMLMCAVKDDLIKLPQI